MCITNTGVARACRQSEADPGQANGVNPCRAQQGGTLHTNFCEKDRAMPHSPNPGRRATLAGLAFLPWAGGRAFAQSGAFPTRTIRLIVPFSPGGGPDVTARRVAEALTTRLGKQVIVDNRVGATGMIGMTELARAPADGYTIVLINLANAIAQAMQAKPPVELTRDTAPIALIGNQYTVLCVAPNSPARTVALLVKLLKASPGAYTFGSGGNGTPAHLAGELFRRAVGGDARHIPSKAIATALTDVGRGEVSFIFSIGNSAIPLIRSGRLRALAVAAPQRIAAMPDLPTMAEAGVAGVELQSWTGLAAPAGTPAPLIEQLNRALRDVVAAAEMRQFFENLGIEVADTSAQEFGALVRAETVRWAAFVKQAGIGID